MAPVENHCLTRPKDRYVVWCGVVCLPHALSAQYSSTPQSTRLSTWPFWRKFIPNWQNRGVSTASSSRKGQRVTRLSGHLLVFKRRLLLSGQWAKACGRRGHQTCRHAIFVCVGTWREECTNRISVILRNSSKTSGIASAVSPPWNWHVYTWTS
jgi:hypothetical protein